MSDCGCHEQFVCDYCDEAFERYRQIIMGWAFDAGMREAERDRAQRCFVLQLGNERAAVAAERQRCADDAELLRQLLAILSQHVGETGESEGAVDVLNRLLREHKCPISRDESGAPAPREG